MTPRRIQLTTRFEGTTQRGGKLPAGRLIAIVAVTLLPEDATHDEVLEWVAYEMGCGSISVENPLHQHDLQVEAEPTLEDTGYTSDAIARRREVFG